MEDIKQYFIEQSNVFTIFVVEQRFVVGQGKEYFHSYIGTRHFLSTEESIKQYTSRVLSWIQKHIPNITEIIKMCLFPQDSIGILEIITELNKLFSVHEHQAVGPDVIDPIIIQEGDISAKTLAKLIVLYESSVLKPAIIILLKDNNFERAKKIFSNCPHGMNIKMIRNSGQSEMYTVINTGANNIDDFIDAFSNQCFSTCSRTPKKLLLNEEWAGNSTLKLYTPSMLKIRSNLLFDEKDEVRDDINNLITECKSKISNTSDSKELLLMKNFECILRLFRVYCNDFGGEDLKKSELFAKQCDNKVLLAYVYRYSNFFIDRDFSKRQAQLEYAENIFRESSIEDHAIYCMNNRLVNTFYTESIPVRYFEDMQIEAINNVPGLVGMWIGYNKLDSFFKVI